jgi:hypothetical protein
MESRGAVRDSRASSHQAPETAYSVFSDSADSTTWCLEERLQYRSSPFGSHGSCLIEHFLEFFPLVTCSRSPLPSPASPAWSAGPAAPCGSALRSHRPRTVLGMFPTGQAESNVPHRSIRASERQAQARHRCPNKKRGTERLDAQRSTSHSVPCAQLASGRALDMPGKTRHSLLSSLPLTHGH